jgi:hypothetical protein
MHRAGVKGRLIDLPIARGGCCLLLCLLVMCGGTSERTRSNDGPSAARGAMSGQAGDRSSNAGGSGGSIGRGGIGNAGSLGGGATHTGGSAPEDGAGMGGEAGNAPPHPDLPQDPTPGRIRCGSTTCDAQSQLCCSGMAGSGVGGASPADSGAGGLSASGSGAGGSGIGTGFESCSPTFCPYRRECDEPADCIGTEVCCFHVVASPPAVLASSCQQPEMCAFDGYWLGCGSQDDCAAAGAPDCVAQVCKGQTIQTCGPITRTACAF